MLARFWTALFSAALLLAVAGLASAQTRPLSPLQRLLEVERDPQLRAAAIKSGEQLARSCVGCHGAAGRSTMPEVPSLAGQNLDYLLTEIREFSGGIRRHQTMEAMVRVLAENEQVDVALYFSSQARREVANAGAREASKGAVLYLKGHCVTCHGERADGGGRIPRLAGQQIAYIVKSLRNYRKKSADRRDAMMEMVLAEMSDTDIKLIAGYLKSLDCGADCPDLKPLP